MIAAATDGSAVHRSACCCCCCPCPWPPCACCCSPCVIAIASMRQCRVSRRRLTRRAAGKDDLLHMYTTRPVVLDSSSEAVVDKQTCTAMRGSALIRCERKTNSSRRLQQPAPAPALLLPLTARSTTLTCVLADPAGPHSSVICPVRSPPPSISSSLQNRTVRLRSAALWNGVNSRAGESLCPAGARLPLTVQVQCSGYGYRTTPLPA